MIDMKKRTCLVCGCLLISWNTLSIADHVQLFDGRTLSEWTTLDGRPVAKGWSVVDGMIRLDPRQGRAGAIITKAEFGDFDLEFEWKIAAGGNSGLKYRVRRYSGGWYGCEYQILDDFGYRRKLFPRHSAGSLYDLYEPCPDKRLLPAGQFNSSRIVVQQDRVQHWLNGQLIVSATVGDDDWRSRVAASKFADLDDFGRNSRGKIMLTDHGSEVWFRNLKLELLPGDQ
jgi:hypothetical protein